MISKPNKKTDKKTVSKRAYQKREEKLVRKLNNEVNAICRNWIESNISVLKTDDILAGLMTVTMFTTAKVLALSELKPELLGKMLVREIKKVKAEIAKMH